MWCAENMFVCLVTRTADAFLGLFNCVNYIVSQWALFVCFVHFVKAGRFAETFGYYFLSVK